MRFNLPQMKVFFTQNKRAPEDYLNPIKSEVIGCSDDGKTYKLRFEGSLSLEHIRDWVSCQIGQSRLFQVKDGNCNFRILTMDPERKCYDLERNGVIKIKSQLCLANLMDSFVFLIAGDVSRYSLTDHRWEPMPNLEQPRMQASACSLGQNKLSSWKVYVFGGIVRDHVGLTV